MVYITYILSTVYIQQFFRADPPAVMGTHLSRKSRIKIVIFFTSCMFLGELVFGYITKSIALITDAFHMLSDIFALCIAHYAITLTESKSYGTQHTYGWQRAETIGALVNAVFLIALCFSIFLKAIERFIEPVPITQPLIVLIVGAAGLFVNIGGLFLFHDAHGPHDATIGDQIPTTLEGQLEQVPRLAQTDVQHVVIPVSADHRNVQVVKAGSLNMKAAFLHVLGDALGSVGVVVSAAIIKWSNWEKSYYLDPGVSVLIAGIIIMTTWKLFRQTCNILLHIVPSNISIQDIRRDIMNLSYVHDLHELHVWQLSNLKTIASVHVIINESMLEDNNYMKVSNIIKKILHMHKIHNTTVQLETRSNVPETFAFRDTNQPQDSCLVPCDESECKEVTCCPHENDP